MFLTTELIANLGVDVWKALAVAWLIVPFVLAYLAISLWKIYIVQEKIKSIDWVLLEIKNPNDIDKSPKVAEQMFAGLHGALIPLTWKEKFFKGNITKWFSLEIVGSSGGINFFIRTPQELRNLVEAQVFAQYPEAEIVEVEDYINNFPEIIPDEDYNLWGCEFKLVKDDVYPIVTYSEFEQAGTSEDIKNIDPLASFTDVLSRLRSGENIWIQFLIQPTGPEVNDNWRKEGEAIINKLMGREDKKEASLVQSFVKSLDSGINSAFGVEVKKEEKKDQKQQFLSASEDEIAKAINRSISKLGFRSGIRFGYIANKEVFSMSHVSGVMGAFKQFASQNLNAFKPAKITGGRGWLPFFFPSDKGFFSDNETDFKKKRHFRLLRDRGLPLEKQFILNTEELATLFHLPSSYVQTPLIPRVQSKRSQSPSQLPIK